MDIQPIPGEPTRWLVASSSRPDTAFVVDSDDDGRWACGCEDCMVRRRECKHIRELKQRGLTRHPY